MTLKFKKTVNKTVHIGIVFDKSSSMDAYRMAAVNALNDQIRSFREEAQKTGIPTRLSILTFSYNNVITMDIADVDVLYAGDIDESSYQPYGNTALTDAMLKMLNTFQQKTGRFLLLVVTDGEENNSINYPHAVRNAITKLGENLTVAVCCPQSGVQYMTTHYGLTPGQMKVWEQSEAGLKDVAQTTSVANTQLFSSYSRGATRSASYFAPDLNNLPKTIVQTNLTEVTNEFETLKTQEKRIHIRDVVQNAGRTFRVGENFYQLIKTETVQSFKDIILRDKATNQLYTGEGIRSLLRIPEGGEFKLKPSMSNEYDVFIRSTSWNRNMLANQLLLVRKALKAANL